MSNNLKSILLIAGGIILAGLMGVAASVIAHSRNSPASLPAPAVTGSYSTSGLSGSGCRHTGPGWVVLPTGIARDTYYVKDVYYCPQTTGGAVIPVKGDPYNLLVPFSFSSKDPGKS